MIFVFPQSLIAPLLVLTEKGRCSYYYIWLLRIPFTYLQSLVTVCLQKLVFATAKSAALQSCRSSSVSVLGCCRCACWRRYYRRGPTSASQNPHSRVTIRQSISVRSSTLCCLTCRQPCGPARCRRQWRPSHGRSDRWKQT